MFLSVFFVMAMAAQAMPTASTEMLGIDAPNKFRVANHQRNDKVEIIELVAPPETVDRCSKIITSLMFFGAAQSGLDAFEFRWQDVLRSGCPGMTDSVVQGSVDGHPAIRSRLSCPKNSQTGEPENMNAVLVRGDANLMMAQISFRHAVTPQDTALIEHIIGSLKVCDQRTIDLCRARKATGFLAAP